MIQKTLILISEFQITCNYEIINLELQFIESKCNFLLTLTLFFKNVLLKYNTICLERIKIHLTFFNLKLDFFFGFFFVLFPFLSFSLNGVVFSLNIQNNIECLAYSGFLFQAKIKSQFLISIFFFVLLFLENYSYSLLRVVLVKSQLFDILSELWCPLYIYFTEHLKLLVIFFSTFQTKFDFGATSKEFLSQFIDLKNAFFYSGFYILVFNLTEFKIKLILPNCFYFLFHITFLLNSFNYFAEKAFLEVLNFRITLLLPFYLYLRPFVGLASIYVFNDPKDEIITFFWQIASYNIKVLSPVYTNLNFYIKIALVVFFDDLKFKILWTEIKIITFVFKSFFPLYVFLRPYVSLTFSFFFVNLKASIVSLQLYFASYAAKLLYPFFLFLLPCVIFVIYSFRNIIILGRSWVVQTGVNFASLGYLILSYYVELAITFILSNLKIKIVLAKLVIVECKTKYFIWSSYFLDYAVKTLIKLNESLIYGIYPAWILDLIILKRNDFKYGVIALRLLNSLFIQVCLKIKFYFQYTNVFSQVELAKYKAKLFVSIYIFSRRFIQGYSYSSCKISVIKLKVCEIFLDFGALPFNVIWFYFWSFFYFRLLSLLSDFLESFVYLGFFLANFCNYIQFFFWWLKNKIIFLVSIKADLFILHFNWILFKLKFFVYSLFDYYYLHGTSVLENIFFSKLSFSLLFVFLANTLFFVKKFFILLKLKYVGANFWYHLIIYISGQGKSWCRIFCLKAFSALPQLVYCFLLVELLNKCRWFVVLVWYSINYTAVPASFLCFVNTFFFYLSHCMFSCGVPFEFKFKIFLTQFLYTVYYFSVYIDFSILFYADYVNWHANYQWFFFKKMIPFMYGPRFECLFLVFFLRHFYCNCTKYPFTEFTIREFILFGLRKSLIKTLSICVSIEIVISFAFEVAHIILIIYVVSFFLWFLTFRCLLKRIRNFLIFLVRTNSPYKHMLFFFFFFVFITTINLFNNYIFYTLYRTLWTFGFEFCQPHFFDKQKTRYFFVSFKTSKCTYLVDQKKIVTKALVSIVVLRFFNRQNKKLLKLVASSERWDNTKIQITYRKQKFLRACLITNFVYKFLLIAFFLFLFLFFLMIEPLSKMFGEGFLYKLYKFYYGK